MPPEVEYRTVLQVVEAASEDKKVLGYHRERRKDPDLLCDNRLLYDGNCPEENGYQTVYLRDVADRKYLINRYYASPRTIWSS